MAQLSARGGAGARPPVWKASGRVADTIARRWSAKEVSSHSHDACVHAPIATAQQYEFGKIQEEVKKLAHEVSGRAPKCC
jgi:hypothetical protein